MTLLEIVNICTGKLTPGFAYRYAPLLGASEKGIEHLWEAYKRSGMFGLSPAATGHLQMRSLYILEKIYFQNPDRFRPYFLEFLHYLPPAKPYGTCRIYLKIAADILRRDASLAGNGEELLSFCLELVTGGKTPPATVIWAVEVLFALKRSFPILDEILPDLTEQMRQVPLPSIQSRVRKWFSGTEDVIR